MDGELWSGGSLPPWMSGHRLNHQVQRPETLLVAHHRLNSTVPECLHQGTAVSRPLL